MRSEYVHLVCSCKPLPLLLAGDVLAPLVSSLPLELRPTIEAFLANCLAVFDDLDASLLEMNPFTFDGSGLPFPLDIRMVRRLTTLSSMQSGLQSVMTSLPAAACRRTFSSCDSNCENPLLVAHCF